MRTLPNLRHREQRPRGAFGVVSDDILKRAVATDPRFFTDYRHNGGRIGLPHARHIPQDAIASLLQRLARQTRGVYP